MPTNIIDINTGFFTNYVAALELGGWFRAAAITPPAALYLGLSTTPASRTGSVAEPPGGVGYARIALPTATTFEPANRSLTASLVAQTWTPTADWPAAILSCFIADAATGGNILWMANLTATRSVSLAGGPVSFAPGALVVAK